MKEKNKGITLIALIITIIIMLILVAVSISLALNSGLFEKTGKATQDWQTEQNKEGELASGKVTIGNTTYNSIDEYIAEISGEKEIHSWTRSGDTITCSHCSRTLTIGQEVNYTAGGSASTSISEAASGIAQAKIDGKSWASSYGVQTLSKDAETKWVVLGIEDSNGDLNNETLLLTTATPTTGTIRLYGAAAYNNAIGEINRMCKELYGADAEGMTIEDVNNCLGYTPAGGMYYDGSTYKTTGNFTTKISELEIWSNIQSYNETNTEGKYYTSEYPEGTTDASKLGDYPLDGYAYFKASREGQPNGAPVLPDSTSTTVKNLIFGASDNYGYWLASRGVYADSNYAYFGPGAVRIGIAYSCREAFLSYGDSNGYGFSVRAVVSLRSEIPAGV